MQTSTDNELVTSYRAGAESAFAEIVARHMDTVFHFALGYVHEQYVAEDITQETFVKAWKNISAYDSTKPFRTWLFAIAKNTALDYLKKQKTIPFSAIGEEGMQLVEVGAGLQPQAAEFNFENDLSQLQEHEREILDLHYRQGFRFREIGAQLRQPMNTIKTWHRRAIQKLRAE